MRYQFTCIVCGKAFWASRSHVQTCSTKCRSKLSRIRAKKQSEVRRQTMTLEQSANIGTIEAISPIAAASLRRMYAVYGKEILTDALEVATTLWNDCHAYHERKPESALEEKS